MDSDIQANKVLTMDSDIQAHKVLTMDSDIQANKVLTMDSDIQAKEYAVSGPLKHLLSLNWESNRIASKSKIPEVDIEQSNPKKKKVRFADEVEEILCDDNSSEVYTNSSICGKIEKDENDRTSCSQWKEVILPIKNEVSEASMIIDEITNNENDYLENENVIPSDPVNAKDENTLTETLDSKINMMEDKTFLQEKKENLQSACILSKSDICDLTSKICSLHLPQSSNLSEKAPFQKSPTLQSLTDDASSSLAQMKKVHFSEEKFNERLHQKVCNQTQSMELTSVLAKDTNVSCASELKTAVFKAWYRVKKKTRVIEYPTSEDCNTKPDSKTLINKNSKEHSTSNSKRAYGLWKKSKNKSVKSEGNEHNKSMSSFSELRGNKKSDKEEEEMAFKMWKKRKDDILKQRRVSEKMKEEQHNAILLMNANQKKKEAEAAFSAWESHKSHMMEIENKKKVWLEHIEKEKCVKETLRDEEALKVYNLWLETKHFPCERHSFYSEQTKPPWIPPGKPPV